jgi:hypothetical protein
VTETVVATERATWKKGKKKFSCATTTTTTTTETHVEPIEKVETLDDSKPGLLKKLYPGHTKTMIGIGAFAVLFLEQVSYYGSC